MRATSNAEDVSQTFDALSDIMDGIETKAAHEICEVMRAYAVKKITQQRAVDTGALRNSVSTAEDIIIRDGQTSISIGIETAQSYAKYIEYGTGILGDPEVSHVQKDKWVAPNPKYDGPDGKEPRFIMRFAQHPRPFMRPALYDNRKVFMRIIKREIKEVFEQ
mgnify:CR=1 FL=1